LDSDTKLT